MVIKKNENAPAAAAAAAPGSTTTTTAQTNGAKQQQQQQTTTTKKQSVAPAENAKVNGNGDAPTDAAAAAAGDSNGEDVQNGGTAAAQGSEEADFAQLNEQLLLMGNALKAVTVLLKGLQKKTTKLAKVANKKQKRGGGGAAAEGKERQSNAFAKPNKVSDELCAFLKVPRGTEMSRTQVTKQLTQYVKDHKLQKEDDKRVINPDAALLAVLQVSPEEKVTYFNLQRLIKHHFIKDDAPQAAAPAAAAN